MATLQEAYPDLVPFWHPTKNLPRTPETVYAGGKKKYWWIDEHGHEWETIIANKAKGSRCPYCSGTKILEGFNDLKSQIPEIASQWHPTKNSPLTPKQISVRSAKKVWWLGECGHEWEAAIHSRTHKQTGCPYCSGNKVLPGFNDLATTHPTLTAQWHPTKNFPLTPEDVSFGSQRKVWWSGECGHEWETNIVSRQRFGCPVCAGKTILKGYNQLTDLNPDFLQQWHPTKNDFQPEMLTRNSNRPVWWVCKCGHEWETTVTERQRGKGCKQCANKKFVSAPEEEIYQYVNTLVSAIQTDRLILKGSELDIYVPSKKIGIEFNGLYWHSENSSINARTRHRAKWSAAKEAGVQLIQIWEDDWKRNPELVKRMLAYKLGVSQERTVYARKTQIRESTRKTAQTFFTENHIQGYAAGSYYLSLIEDSHPEKIIAMLTLRKDKENALNIIRYATSCSVVGGFTKLLTYAERTYNPDKFITFADHCVSDGGLYENNGFIADKELPPDYMYVVHGERKHKFGYRLTRFRNDPNLKFEEGLTERELAALNNLPRIWDAGKTRYVKQF